MITTVTQVAGTIYDLRKKMCLGALDLDHAESGLKFVPAGQAHTGSFTYRITKGATR